MRKIVVGIMGPGDGASDQERTWATALGRGVALAGWVLLSGGRNVGVMEAANQGARAAGGLTVGILPDADGERLSEAVDIAIFTDMGNARNNINVLSSDVVVSCGMGLGTASEIVLAIKAGKSVILLSNQEQHWQFFQGLAPGKIQRASAPDQVIALIQAMLV
ncbi:MAG: cytochrome [Magnetococcales bacterium]|nr:cytochrome [Magnetococcales bacterium]